MIEIKFKRCCGECKEIKTYINKIELCADNRTEIIDTTIGCEHETVCKQYMEEETETGIITKQWIKRNEYSGTILHNPASVQGWGFNPASVGFGSNGLSD